MLQICTDTNTHWYTNDINCI